jgi:putative transposase
MTHHSPDATTLTAALELLTRYGFDGMATAIELLLNESMKIERSEFLGAGPYERTAERRGHANGFKPKRVNSRLGRLELSIPQVRGLDPGDESFYPEALTRGERSERALKLAVAEMYVQGVSTRKVTEITRELCGLDVSSSQVSRISKLLDDELEAWRTRPLGEIPYLILDARYEKVRHGGHVIDCAVLIAAGVMPNGKRIVLGCSVSLSEAEVHWRTLLGSLMQRGLRGVRFVTSDDHAGLKAALAATLPGTTLQRCQFHLQQNAQAYVPRLEDRPAVAQDIRTIFYAPDLHEANRLLARVVESWSKRAPRLAEWMEANLPEGLAVLSLPVPHRKRMRTTNMLERLNRELKRRTRVATLFPNEASLLRLTTAVLAEITEDWETNRIYLNMEAD